MPKIQREEMTSDEIAEAVRVLADQIEYGAEVATVVCVMRVGDSLRLYALGDDTSKIISEAAIALDGASTALSIANQFSGATH